MKPIGSLSPVPVPVPVPAVPPPQPVMPKRARAARAASPARAGEWGVDFMEGRSSGEGRRGSAGLLTARWGLAQVIAEGDPAAELGDIAGAGRRPPLAQVALDRLAALELDRADRQRRRDRRD